MEEKHNNHNLLNSLLSVVDPFQVAVGLTADIG